MNILLYAQSELHRQLLPLTYLKPVAELRMGILTFKERWEKILQTSVSTFSPQYLQDLFPKTEDDINLYIKANILPTHKIIETVRNINIGEAVENGGDIIAFYGNKHDFESENYTKIVDIEEEIIQIKRPYDLFTYNHIALDFDFELLTKDKTSQPISSTNGVIHPEKIFLEEGAKVEFAILNATDGPIYIGKNAEICEGSMIRGGLALCNNAKLNLGTKIYGSTTIGPYCKVGGEVNNSILQAYSNKGHDGFLGNSVIGEWCNLGADTNNSNLKNNYGEVKLWNYASQNFEKTNLQFCGLMMGDHTKAAINTQFNTGTVTGIFANIFKAGFPPNQIQSFSWGGFKDSPIFKLDSAYEVAERMMERRKVPLTQELKDVIAFLYKSEPIHRI